MPKASDWLFDEQGRMRDDLPPLLNPYGNAPRQQPTGVPEVDDFIDRLGLEFEADGWTVKPRRWSNPTGGTPFNGLMFRRDFNLLAGGRR